MSLLDAEEMAAIRDVGEDQMDTPVKVFRPTFVDTSGTPANDLGDSELSDPVAGEAAPVLETTAWFVSHLATEIQQGAGQLATVDRHIVRLPWRHRADIHTDDIIQAVDTGAQYTVIDTNGDDTWAEWLQARVRRSE